MRHRSKFACFGDEICLRLTGSKNFEELLRQVRGFLSENRTISCHLSLNSGRLRILRFDCGSRRSKTAGRLEAA